MEEYKKCVLLLYSDVLLLTVSSASICAVSCCTISAFYMCNTQHHLSTRFVRWKSPRKTLWNKFPTLHGYIIAKTVTPSHIPRRSFLNKVSQKMCECGMWELKNVGSRVKLERNSVIKNCLQVENTEKFREIQRNYKLRLSKCNLNLQVLSISDKFVLFFCFVLLPPTFSPLPARILVCHCVP